MDPSSFVREVTAFLQHSTRSADDVLRLIEIVYHVALKGEMPAPKSRASALANSDRQQESGGEASWAQLLRHAQILLRSASNDVREASSGWSDPAACNAYMLIAANNPAMHGLRASFFWKSSFSLLSDTLLAGMLLC